MIEVRGKFNSAKIFTDSPDEKTVSQIIELCNQEFAKDSQIRIMPDCHYGAGCTIGTTMTIQDKIVPNLVGVDIGCGMFVSIIKQNKDDIPFDKLDELIRRYVPSGQRVHDKRNRHPLSERVDFRNIIAPINLNRAKDSMGTLGGGNHFIEINEIDEGTIALVIHSGSRSLGAEIAKFYQNTAYEYLTDNRAEKQLLIERLKREGREQEIETELKKIQTPNISRELAYLTGKNYDNYLNDMRIAQHYAVLNRQAIADIIMRHMDWVAVDSFDTIHNYIDLNTMILRKGAISAKKGERVIVPINMRDGSIIAYGKGNPDWNFSGPHGAGRVLSRSKAREHIDFKAFEDSMRDVWSTSVNPSTVDESPMAYKTLDHILNNVTESLDVQQIIKPIYNFKA